MEINECKFDIESDCLNRADEDDIIILDDDDFIQTTLSLFSQNETIPHTSATESSLNESQGVLIDLTSCDDFDLNDIFLMNSQNLNSNSQNTEHDFKSQSFIKNEFDFKVFNFNLNNFENCIEEILIDDDNIDLNNERDSNDSEPESSLRDEPGLGSFNAYRTNDSSSESSRLREFKCQKCLKVFNKSYNYKRHLFVHKAQSGDADTSENTNFKVNECSRCKKKISDKSNFAKHLRICNQKGSKKCEQDEFISSPNLSRELLRSNAKLSQRFECEICSKVFNKKFNYHRHIRVHFLNEIMNNQHEPSSSNYFKTMEIINAKKIKTEIYDCENCKRKFESKNQLQNHKLKWHLSEYNCKYCEFGVKFKEKFDYIKHLNSVHSIKFKFECKYCKKTFRYISQYIQHKKTHLVNQAEQNDDDDDSWDILMKDSNSNLESLRCHLCGKYFSKLFNLKRHLSTIHLDKNVELNIEENYSDNFSTSVVNHNIDKLKYNCNLSQKNFYRRNKLNSQLDKININK